MAMGLGVNSLRTRLCALALRLGCAEYLAGSIETARH